MKKTTEDFLRTLGEVARETTLTSAEKLAIRNALEAQLSPPSEAVPLAFPDKPSPASQTPTA